MQRLRTLAMTLIGVLMIGVGIVTAQNTQCRADVIDILQQVGDYCDATGRNEACYGNPLVEASFNAATPPPFAEPADRVDVQSIDQLRPYGWSSESQEWGVALLQIQADLPEALPGQNVKMLLMGNLTLENAVSTDEAVSTANSVTTTTQVASVVRAAPSDTATAIDAIDPNTDITVYGTDQSGDWLRLAADAPRWVHRSLVEETAPLDNLPVLDDTSVTPMQAIRLETGISQPECRDAPNSMLVQSPEGSEVRLVINEQNISVGSTVVVTLEDNVLKLAVLDGAARVGGRIGVQTGYAIQTDLDADGNASERWYGMHQLTETELAAYTIYEEIPGSLLHYPIAMPDISSPQPQRNASSGNNTPSNTNTSDNDDNNGSSDDNGGNSSSSSDTSDSDAGESDGGESEED